jgi:hypothetical protein
MVKIADILEEFSNSQLLVIFNILTRCDTQMPTMNTHGLGRDTM